MKSSEKVRIWMRLGITLEVSPEQAEDILRGKEKTLRLVVDNFSGKWYPDGESYIPDEIADELREKLGLKCECEAEASYLCRCFNTEFNL